MGNVIYNSLKAQFDELKSSCSLLEELDEDSQKDSEEYQILAEKFIERAKKVPAGPGSVRKFRTWLAERMARDILEDEKFVKVKYANYKGLKR